MDSNNQLEDVSDLLAKDLVKSFIERDLKLDENRQQKEAKIKFKKPIDYNLVDLKYINKSTEEIVENSLQELASLNDLVNHAIDRTLGLNETTTPLNIIKNTTISNNCNLTKKKSIRDNDSVDFKVPSSPKRFKSKLKDKSSESVSKNEKTTESINSELKTVDQLPDELKKSKKKKKKKDEKHTHRCSKHRKRKELDEVDEFYSKSNQSTDHQLSPTSSKKVQYFNETYKNENYNSHKPNDKYDSYCCKDVKDKYYEDKYYEDKYYDDKYYDDKYYDDKYPSGKRFKRTSIDESNKSSSNNHYSDDEYEEGRSKKYDSTKQLINRPKSRHHYNDRKEYENKDPFYIKKLRNDNSLSNWTKFCYKSTKRDDDDDNSSIESRDFYSDDDDKRSIISDRFMNRDSLKSKEIKFDVKDFKSRQARSATEIKQVLMDQFPVSSGVKHQWKEVDKPENSTKKDEKKSKKSNKAKEKELIEDKVDDFLNKHVQLTVDPNDKIGFDIGSIMSQRLAALKILKTDVNNITALNQLKQADELINEWSKSKPMNNEGEIVENTNEDKSVDNFISYSDFTKAAKSKDGIGVALLQKMGWQPGQGLGKNNEGVVEPLIPELKLDTKGLIADEEKNKKNNVLNMYNIPQISNVNKSVQKNQPTSCEQLTQIANQSIVNGKHPVNILQEVCSKRKWTQPTYTIISEDGPAHKKNFLIKCNLNKVDYVPSFSSPNKKLAKAIAAIVCLQAFGLVDGDEIK